jgi:hypothetical protein
MPAATLKRSRVCPSSRAARSGVTFESLLITALPAPGFRS